MTKMSSKMAVLGQKCHPLGTETFLGENGFVYKRLVDLDTGKTAMSTYVKRVGGELVRVSTGEPAVLCLRPGIRPPDYHIGRDKAAEIAAINAREEMRRLKNYELYLKGKNPCVEKAIHMHRSNIPERTYDGWWDEVG